jgi:heme exporter protein C
MHNRLGSISKLLLGVWMAGVMVAVFLVIPRYEGLGYAGRIMVIHVPTAWVSVVAFALSALFSGLYLWRGDTRNDDRALAAAESGFLFTILATVTGMLFSQIMWGVYWNWDPRQTSIFVLLLIYAALFALRSSLMNIDQRRRLSAVYSLFAFVTVPFLIFIVPRMSNSTLHPNCAIVGGENCNGVDLQVGHIGLLGDRKVKLINLDQQGDTLTAEVLVSEPGLHDETTWTVTYNLATGSPNPSPDMPGLDYHLVLQAADIAQGQITVNIETPGTGILDNQRTFLTFLAAITGFTGLFVWMFLLRARLLGIQWDLARREGMFV